MFGVKVPGMEWPGSEWDTRDAWYTGNIERESGDTVYVKFEDYDEALPFRRDILKTYEDMYADFRVDVLCDLLTLAM